MCAANRGVGGLLAETKPDFAEARKRWRHYWAGEVWKRPPVLMQVRKPGVQPPRDPHATRYLNPINGLWDEQIDIIEEKIEATLYLAESIPYASPDFGPDQFASFFGTEMHCHEDSPGTSWVTPIVDDWNDSLPLRFDEDDPSWQRSLGYAARLRERSAGRYLVGCCDLHSNADALLALRTGEKLCMDFYDCPDLIEKAMHGVRAAYRPIYEGLRAASGVNEETGSIGWLPFWCDGRFATIQCDFICMVSPEIGRKFIIPALEEEAAFLDHCAYHLDGPGALPHLDDLLAIEGLDAVQWVAGAGQPPMHEWLDVFRRCQAAGKGLILYCNPDQMKSLHGELRPEGLVYSVGVGTREEGDEVCAWLEANT